MSDISDIVAVVEAVRARKYQALSPGLVEAILKIEADFVDDRVEAAKRIGRTVEDYCSQQEQGDDRAQAK